MMFKKLDIEFDEIGGGKGKGGGPPKRKRFRIGTEDIIAIGGVLIAIIVVLGMVFGKLPVNELTGGLAGVGAIGAAAAQVIKAKRESGSAKSKKKK